MATKTPGISRPARTRAALIGAAQALLAQRRTSVPVLEITQLADVGLGSFYNHFGDKDELFAAAVEDALERFGGLLDSLSDHPDPAVVFAQSLRLTGRAFRFMPELTRVLINRGVDASLMERGLGPRALRDIEAGVAAGRFRSIDSQIALSVVAGGVLALGALLDSDLTRDADDSADAFAVNILCMLGLRLDEAEEICQLPLPEIDALAQAALEGELSRRGE